MEKKLFTGRFETPPVANPEPVTDGGDGGIPPEPTGNETSNPTE
jgi:hypothetical protein